MKTIRGLSYNSTLGGSDIITRNKMTQNPDGSVSIWVANHAQPCIVDLNVALELAPFRVSRSSPGYFSFKDTPSTSVWVHRFVRGIPPPGWQVDHIDRDRSNNRFTNLRFLTEHENKRNRVIQTCSGVPNITWSRAEMKWKVEMRLNHKSYFGGYHKDFFEAIKSLNGIRVSLGLPRIKPPQKSPDHP